MTPRSTGYRDQHLSPTGDSDHRTILHPLADNGDASLLAQVSKERRRIENRCRRLASALARLLSPGLVSRFFGSDFRPPVRDQLIRQADAGSQVGEHAARRLDDGASMVRFQPHAFRGKGHHPSLDPSHPESRIGEIDVASYAAISSASDSLCQSWR